MPRFRLGLSQCQAQAQRCTAASSVEALWAWLMPGLQATAKPVGDLCPRPRLPGCCRFDKVFGMFKTKAGKWRRLDVIMSPFEQYPFCLLGWTGSRQW